MFYYFDIKNRDKINKLGFIKNIKSLIKSLEADISNPPDMLDGESDIATILEGQLESAKQILTDISSIKEDEIGTTDNKYCRSFNTFLTGLHDLVESYVNDDEYEEVTRDNFELFSQLDQAKRNYETNRFSKKVQKEPVSTAPLASLQSNLTLAPPPRKFNYCNGSPEGECIQLSKILDKPNQLKDLLPTKDELNKLKNDDPEKVAKVIESQKQYIKDLDNLPKFIEDKRIPDPNDPSKELIYWKAPGEEKFNPKTGIIYTVAKDNPSEILAIQYGEKASAIVAIPPKDDCGACITLIENNNHNIYGDTSLIKFKDINISKLPTTGYVGRINNVGIGLTK